MNIGYLGGYCAVPAGTAQAGTAHCSTGSTENPFGYCTVPNPVMGTVQYPQYPPVLRYCSWYCGYCAVPDCFRYCTVPRYCRRVLHSTSKRSGSPVSFWKYVQNDPGIEPGVAGVHGDAITIRPPLHVIMGSLIIGLFTP